MKKLKLIRRPYFWPQEQVTQAPVYVPTGRGGTYGVVELAPELRQAVSPTGPGRTN